MPSARTAIPSYQRLPGREGGAVRRARSRRVAEATDRDHLLERLQHLRAILPVLAQDLASARRQAAALRVENRGLLEEVRRLRGQSRGRPVGEGAPTRRAM